VLPEEGELRGCWLLVLRSLRSTCYCCKRCFLCVRARGDEEKDSVCGGVGHGTSYYQVQRQGEDIGQHRRRLSNQANQSRITHAPLAPCNTRQGSWNKTQGHAKGQGTRGLAVCIHIGELSSPPL